MNKYLNFSDIYVKIFICQDTDCLIYFFLALSQHISYDSHSLTNRQSHGQCYCFTMNAHPLQITSINPFYKAKEMRVQVE